MSSNSFSTPSISGNRSFNQTSIIEKQSSSSNSKLQIKDLQLNSWTFKILLNSKNNKEMATYCQKTQEGRNILHFLVDAEASSNGLNQKELIIKALNFGANPLELDPQGRKPADYAKEFNYEDAFNILKEAEEKYHLKNKDFNSPLDLS